MPFGICALRAVDALRMRTAMALDCRCHRSAEGEDALLRCVLLRTRCGGGLARALVWGSVWLRFGFGSRRGSWAVCLCHAIRVMSFLSTRCPCAGRHVFLLASAVWPRGPAGLVCLCFCWHPRYGICRSCVAPVRGGMSFRWHPRFDFVARLGWFACVFAGIRVTVSAVHASPLRGAACLFASIRGLTSWRGRFGLLVFLLASALRYLPFKRRPCAGRHLLFFAAVYRLETSLTHVQGHR
jgi:hypothetical protein